MSDTGDEHPETYGNVERLRSLYEEREEEFYFLEAGSPWHSESWPDLITFYRRGDRIGSKSFPKIRFRTRKPLPRRVQSDRSLGGLRQ